MLTTRGTMRMIIGSRRLPNVPVVRGDHGLGDEHAHDTSGDRGSVIISAGSRWMVLLGHGAVALVA